MIKVKEKGMAYKAQIGDVTFTVAEKDDTYTWVHARHKANSADCINRIKVFTGRDVIAVSRAAKLYLGPDEKLYDAWFDNDSQ